MVGVVCGSHRTQAQTKVDIWFYDACSEKVIRNWFHISPTDPSLWNKSTSQTSGKNGVFVLDNVPAGNYNLDTSIKRGGYEEAVRFNFFIEVSGDVFTDTLSLHRISRMYTAVNGNTIYLNCDAHCDGEQEQYDESGTLRLKGTFENGVASTVTEYDEQGEKSVVRFFKKGEVAPSRVEYYYDGVLDSYHLLERINNRKVWDYAYNADGTLKRKVKSHVTIHGGPVIY